MRLFLLISLALGYVSGFSQAFSKTGTDDLYLYKGTVLYKDGNGFIANVQTNFDEISIIDKYGEVFLRVMRKKESVKSLPDLSGMQTKTVETITRHVCKWQIDTSAYGKVKNYTINDRELQGTSLTYFIDQNDSLHAGEVFYFNQYSITTGSYEAEKYKMPILTVIKSFNFCDGAMNEESNDEEDISVVETGDINFPYEVKVPEAFKNKEYHKTSSYLERPIADNYKTGNSQFFALINEQTRDTSFILGSMHATESAFWNKKINQPEILQRLFSCSALYFEGMSDLIIVSEDSTNKSTTTQHRTLVGELTIQQKAFFRHQYNTYLKKSGIAYIDLITFHPLVIGNIFAFTFFAEKNIYLEKILAAVVQEEFIKKGRIDFDFKELDKNEEMADANNFRWKFHSPAFLMNELKMMEPYLKSLWRDYENGDIEKGLESVKNKYGPSFYDTMIVQRNENWLPRMIEGMKQEKCFFVVGSAHLGGPHGIIHLLKEKGYTILPLKWLN